MNNRCSYILYILSAVAAVLAVSGCRTTEANYRAAYQKTMEARAESDDLDATIYGTVRRQTATHTVETQSGPVEVLSAMVRVTTDGGATPERLRRYCVVAAQFKQIFNARSMRERLADSGLFPGAFIVETAEPYYYVVAASFATADEATAAMENLRSQSEITLKEPCPFILDATTRRRPASSSRTK